MKDRTSPGEPAQGWIMVGVAFWLSALSFGGLGSVGVFLKPLASEFGWSRGETSLGYTALSLAAGVLGVAWGVVADRYGSRGLAIMASVAMAAALFLLGRTQNLGQFYLYNLLFGGFGFAALMSPLMANVSFWLTGRMGLAIGLVAAGGAFGQGLVPFIARLLISAYDWRTAYLVLAVGYLIAGLPLAWFVREAPARIAARSAAPAGTAIEDGFDVQPREAVSWISVAVVFCCICMAVPIVHVVPLVSDMGASPELAAGVLMTLMLAGVVGRILGGVLGDRIGALPAYMLLSLSQSVLVIWFPHISGLLGIYLLAAIFGIAYSGVMASILVCMRVMVPAAYAGRALGVSVFFGMVGMGLGGYIGGALFDLTGGYGWSYLVAGLSGGANLIILMLFHLRVRARRRLALVNV